MRIYFAGSIRGGREDAALYSKLINHLKSYGEVLTEHVGETNPARFDDEGLDDKFIHNRDINWLLTADVVVAEGSVPSLGVGYEIGRAVTAGIPVLCLYNMHHSRKLSAMIAGCPQVKTIFYTDIEDVVHELAVALKNVSSSSA